MRVLLLDDDTDLRTDVGAQLRLRGISVDEAGTLADADERLCVHDYDVAVLDRNLPDGDAADMLSRLRAAGMSVPVLFLTCLDEVQHRVEGLDSGGDDYLVKPFAMTELLARVRALSRRTVAVQAPLLTLADLVIDRSRAVVTRAGRPITMTPKEFSLLEYLISHAGQVVTRADLLEHCWDEYAEPVSNVVDARIARLRTKLGDPPLVHTVRGSGYLAVAPT